MFSIVLLFFLLIGQWLANQKMLNEKVFISHYGAGKMSDFWAPANYLTSCCTMTMRT